MKLSRSMIVLLLLAAGLTSGAHAAEPPAVSAESYILMDAASGRALVSGSADEPRLIASTTKIMTALIALEQCDPDREVVIDPAWTGIEGSTMYLIPGQVLTVRDLLYGLMLASGNDAAVALACITAGDTDSFAALMNERAEELGCRNTHFENPNGLDAQRHYSSAQDLAIIAREAIRNDEFRKIVSTVNADICGRTFTNHNRLLRECEGVFGVKTGYTEAAGRTLVSCCERDGITLICVTLDDPDDWADHAALYDWAYGNYVLEDIARYASLSIPVIGGGSDEVTVTADGGAAVLRCSDDVLETRLCVPPFVFADIERGDRAGEAEVFVNGEKTAAVPLMFTESVDRLQTGDRTLRSRLLFLLSLFERKIFSLL